MGEVSVSRGGGGGGVADSPEKTDGGGSVAMAANNVFRWEKFLPRMVLRVLLVEADDSTRHIITALLRNYNYKVAAVSGFALLTLIMEHHVCKNIPVIMMSAHVSLGTVHKCMLRGAADFLVKPVRKNELKNLWQHVWRRQAAISCRGPDMEVEGRCMEQSTMSLSSNMKKRKVNELGSVVADEQKDDASSQEKDFRWERKEAVDLIGSFKTFPETSCRSPSNKAAEDDCSPMLDLSLRSSYPLSSLDILKTKIKL